MNINNDESLLDELDELDKKGGVNSIKESLRPKLTPQLDLSSNISISNEIGWKLVPFNNLPSLGISYPEDSEIAIRSAKTLEIRHWSTIDEFDGVSINDKLNFILEKCMTFRIKDRAVVMDWKDILIIDRFFLIFRIHELTFPNAENTMSKIFSCKQCPTEKKYSNSVKVSSSMLQLFKMPTELLEFYNETNKAFLIESQYYDSFFLCMPTLGVQDKVRSYVKSKGLGLKDEWFVKVLPYIIDDYRSVTNQSLDALRLETIVWHEKKFMFVTLAVDLLENAKSTLLSMKCPNCDNLIQENIFTEPSFTIKNLFIISARLRDLV